MKNATKYLVFGSLGVLMTRRDISSLAVKGLIKLKWQMTLTKKSEQDNHKFQYRRRYTWSNYFELINI